MVKNKLKNQKQIIQIVKELKRRGKKIVTHNGSFDVLHSGHIQSIKEAKAQGDILIILLNSDKSVKTYKGPKRPIVPQKERVELISALEFVDYIVIFDEINPKKILSEIKPDIHCAGFNWGKNCIGRKVVEKNGGKIYALKWVPSLSTSALIKKILNVYSQADVKAIFLDRDGVINFNTPEYLHRVRDFKFVPGVISALQKLSKTDYKIIITTNQSGIGRGYYKESDFKKLHQWLGKEFKGKKIRIDKVYYCPHSPKADCSCRKPALGMLMKAVKDFGIRLDKSWIIGDDVRDIIMGMEANLKTIKIGKKMSRELKLEPHYYAKNLSEAVKIILSKNEK